MLTAAIILVSTAGCLEQASPKSEISALEPADDILVGVNYFAGWQRDKGGWFSKEQDWRPQYPERIPLLGQYNDQETMDKEIIAASDYGVDFFSILYYYDGPGQDRRWSPSRLNLGIKYFVNSPQAHRMKFIVEFCNSHSFKIKTDSQWDHCINIWVNAMRHPSYLRIDGMPVFKIHGWSDLLIKNNDDDLEKCRKRVASLRQSFRDAGLGKVLIGCGDGPGLLFGPGHPAAEIFDFGNTYMGVPEIPKRDIEHPYSVLTEYINNDRQNHAKDAIGYVPYIATAWNPRPWVGNQRHNFKFPTRSQWLGQLRKIRDDLNSCDNFGIILPNGRRQKIFTIYAWNEFGEGGFLAPTTGEGYMKLEAVKQVFGKN